MTYKTYWPTAVKHKLQVNRLYTVSLNTTEKPMG